MKLQIPVLTDYGHVVNCRAGGTVGARGAFTPPDFGRLFNSIKVHIFLEGHKMLRSLQSYFWLALHRTKVRWRFCNILWPSQNIWTLQTRRANIAHHTNNWHRRLWSDKKLLARVFSLRKHLLSL